MWHTTCREHGLEKNTSGDHVRRASPEEIKRREYRMRRVSRRTALGGLILLLALALGGCGGTNSGPGAGNSGPGSTTGATVLPIVPATATSPLTDTAPLTKTTPLTGTTP